MPLACPGVSFSMLLTLPMLSQCLDAGLSVLEAGEMLNLCSFIKALHLLVSTRPLFLISTEYLINPSAGAEFCR